MFRDVPDNLNTIAEDLPFFALVINKLIRIITQSHLQSTGGGGGRVSPSRGPPWATS